MIILVYFKRVVIYSLNYFFFYWIEIFCLNVIDFGNGRVESIDNKVNGSLFYSCNIDFEVMFGNLSWVCMLNGIWSGGLFICLGILL